MQGDLLLGRLRELEGKTHRALTHAYRSASPRAHLEALARAHAFAGAVIGSPDTDERRLSVAIRLAEDALALVGS